MTPADWFEGLGGEEHKTEIVKRHLGRVGLSLDDKATKLPGDTEDPAVEARKAASARSRLAKADALFGVYWGRSLGASPPEAPPRWSAGTPDDRDD